MNDVRDLFGSLDAAPRAYTGGKLMAQLANAFERRRNTTDPGGDATGAVLLLKALGYSKEDIAQLFDELSDFYQGPSRKQGE